MSGTSSVGRFIGELWRRKEVEVVKDEDGGAGRFDVTQE
jgi:hypothetical protein